MCRSVIEYESSLEVLHHPGPLAHASSVNNSCSENCELPRVIRRLRDRESSEAAQSQTPPDSVEQALLAKEES